MAAMSVQKPPRSSKQSKQFRQLAHGASRSSTLLARQTVERGPAAEGEHPQGDEVQPGHKRQDRPPSAAAGSVQDVRNRHSYQDDRQQGHDDGHDPMPFRWQQTANSNLPAEIFHFSLPNLRPR